MPKQQRIIDKDDFILNIRTFDAYQMGSDDQKRFHKRRVKNVENFIAIKVDGRDTFTPTHFAGYKDNNNENYTPSAQRQEREIAKLLHLRCCKPGDKNYEDVNATFDEYRGRLNIERNTKDVRHFWINNTAQEGDRVNMRERHFA
jgi:hypothetical protein